MIRGERRSVALRFSEDRSLLVLVPKDSRIDVDSLLNKHIGWIKKHYAQLINLRKLFDADRVMYRGRYYRTEINETRHTPTVSMSADAVVVNARNLRSARNALSRFLLNETEETTRPLVQEKAMRVDRSVSEIRFKRIKRWGSCDANHRITLNAYLSMLPANVMDYVVSHEVAHLVELNHSKNFWRTVSSLCPDYRVLRKELKDYVV